MDEEEGEGGEKMRRGSGGEEKEDCEWCNVRVVFFFKENEIKIKILLKNPAKYKIISRGVELRIDFTTKG